MKTLELQTHEADSAAGIQQAIDRLASTGGRVVLPEMDLTLDRGIELRSGVELVGRGQATVLRKGPGRIYPLAGYHNYGMCDVPLRSTDGLQPGMTVSVYDDVARGFYETFARVTWVAGGWVGLDHGIEADYQEAKNPRLTTAYPLVFGHCVSGAAIRDLTLDGRRQDQESAMGACRGACVYLARSRDVEISGVRQGNYHGEGLGFQMCRDIRVRDCRFCGNSGNGMHPGAGSTNALFDGCVGSSNDKSGFFFCVRANHVTVRGCAFEDNGNGVSIGTRDSFNVIEDCRIMANRGPGVLVRPVPPSCPAVSILVCRCHFRGNARSEGEGQVAVVGDALDVVLEENRIMRSSSACSVGVYVGAAARRVWLGGNRFEGCDPQVRAESGVLAESRPAIRGGHGAATPDDFRHLDPIWSR